MMVAWNRCLVLKAGKVHPCILAPSFKSSPSHPLTIRPLQHDPNYALTHISPIAHFITKTKISRRN